MVSFVNKYQERYNLTDEAYDEIFENLSSFRICLEYFIENIDDIVIRKVTSPYTVSQENLDFIEKNKTSYMALKKNTCVHRLDISTIRRGDRTTNLCC